MSSRENSRTSHLPETLLKQHGHPMPHITLIKYPNRRLYGPLLNPVKRKTQGYQTLAHVKALIKAGYRVTITEKKTGKNITAEVLLSVLATQTQGACDVIDLHQRIQAMP